MTAELAAAGSVHLAQVETDASDIYWSERRPSEAGRTVVMRVRAGGTPEDVTPGGFNVRTRVHEYGGGAFAVGDGVVFFSNFADQRLYRQEPGGLPAPITREGDFCYADGILDRARGRFLCVREDRGESGREATNSIVSLDPNGCEDGRAIVSGADFYSSPRISPDGRRMAWLSWNHPNMPWDGTELWVGELDGAGNVAVAEKVAGGPRESVCQPEWSSDGLLHFVSDRTGFWNLYRLADDKVRTLCSMDAEFGLPHWVFRQSTYAIGRSGEIYAAFAQGGIWRFARLGPEPGVLSLVETPFTEIRDVRFAGDAVVFVGGGATRPTSLVLLDPARKRMEVLRSSADIDIDDGYLSRPEAVEFPTGGGRTAYALFYPPANYDHEVPQGEKPPLLVRSHGGPTSSASTSRSFEIQFWTSRGFAVVDVNYGGSTGFGRAYRGRLDGLWGVVDVDDCANAALHLVACGRADGKRMAIRGGSAGGYTTLCALTFRDIFRAGACYYGVSDAEALARDTHKFESHYLERLIGPYPERADLYRGRSPVNFVDRLSCPVIFFQGLEDRIVPPDQTERMVDALRRKGIPVAYLRFEGEQHGFRKAESIRRALEAELYFYSRAFGFEPADPMEPVTIENLGGLS